MDLYGHTTSRFEPECLHWRYRGHADAGRDVHIRDCADGFFPANSAKVYEYHDFRGGDSAASHFPDDSGTALSWNSLFRDIAGGGRDPSLYVDVARVIRSIAPGAGAQCLYRADCGNAYVRGPIQLYHASKGFRCAPAKRFE